MDRTFDRAAEDLGNIVGLEHVNVQIPDQRLATLFYITGLGFTRDPYLVTGVVNMWVNVGRSQFHLPTGKPQVVRGRVGLVVPDLGQLARRLDGVRKALEGTQFAFEAKNDRIDVTSPWGNQLRCHAPDRRFGAIVLGMPYVELDVPLGAAPGIARFYRDVFDTEARLEEAEASPAARVAVGQRQHLVFRETAAPLPAFDGHHIQIYIANFSRPHARLKERGLVTEESNPHQYRFNDIVDLESGKVLFTIEHEVRSMTHPLYARPLVNRNPEMTNMAFLPGQESLAWSMAAE
jgi:catechol 2,3-dioxygenase-like lactoylglutathione lyase family enzyme